MLVNSVLPSAAIVTLAEIKLHIRHALSDTTEDAYLTSIVEAVTLEAEKYCNRALRPQTWKLFLDWFPDCREIEIPMAPVTAVSSVKYYDGFLSLQTMNPSLYQVDISSEPSRVALSSAQGVWPTTALDKINAVEIEFTCGYATAADVPAGIKHAIKLACGSLYSSREDEVQGQSFSCSDRTFERMLYPYRLFRFP